MSKIYTKEDNKLKIEIPQEPIVKLMLLDELTEVRRIKILQRDALDEEIAELDEYILKAGELRIN